LRKPYEATPFLVPKKLNACTLARDHQGGQKARKLTTKSQNHKEFFWGFFKTWCLGAFARPGGAGQGG